MESPQLEEQQQQDLIPVKSHKRPPPFSLDDPSLLQDLLSIKCLTTRLLRKIQKTDDAGGQVIKERSTVRNYADYVAKHRHKGSNEYSASEYRDTGLSGDSETVNFLEDNFDRVTHHIQHYKLKKKKLCSYACRMRKADVDKVFEYIAERPTVFRIIFVLIDRERDEASFCFKENKEIAIRNLKILTTIPNVELYKLKDMREMPKKLDQKKFKHTFVHSFLRKGYIYKTTLVENVKLLKEAAIKQRIYDVNFPILDEQSEKHLANLIKVEVEARKPEKDDRFYIPVRNNDLHPIHSRFVTVSADTSTVVIDKPAQENVDGQIHLKQEEPSDSDTMTYEVKSSSQELVEPN